MARLIDVDAFIAEYFENCGGRCDLEDECCDTVDMLMNAPTVDAVSVVHGRWIHDYNNLYGCSECMERETMSPKKLKNYCPNCGADMRERSEGE